MSVDDADDVLLDDRPLVEVLGDVVRGGTHQFHPALLGLGVGGGANEGRKEGVVDVDDRDADFLDEVAGADLHVAGQHDEVDVALEEP
ncbi:hypothetical protein GCM10023323_40060 [Streptomyces thinghirensis]|uniref:DUF5709 domain-containing protein n=1 Tax=Streptomyces thinghirensis TaxID=551547 RepID=A0ABP9T4G6_9ACTN